MDISFALESTMSPKIKKPSSTVVHKKSKAPGKLALRRKIRRSSYLDRFPRRSFLADEKKTPISEDGWNSDDEVALNESFSDLSIITGDYQKKSGIGAINSTFVNTNNNIRFDELFKNNDKQNLINKDDKKLKETEKGEILGNILEATEISSSNDSDCSVVQSSLMSNHEEHCLTKAEPATPVKQLEEAKVVLDENYGSSWRKNESDILRTEPRPRLSTKINRIHKAVCQTDVKKTNSYKEGLLNNKNNNNKLRFSLSDNENDSSVINHISNNNKPIQKVLIKKESYNDITPKTEIRNSNLSDIVQIYNSDSDEEDLDVVESLTEIHLNPYLYHERNKSNQVLRAVQTERVHRKINSTLLKNLKKLCDSESSDDYSPIVEKEKTKTFVRTEWVNRKSNTLSKQVDITNDTTSSNESDVASRKVPVRLKFEESDSEDDVFVKEPPRKNNLVKKNLSRKKSVSFSKDSDLIESSDSDNVVTTQKIKTPFKSKSIANSGNTRDIDLKKQSDSKRSNIKSKLALLRKDTPKNRHESKKIASSDSNSLIDSSDSEGIKTQNNCSKTPPKQIASNLFTKDGTPRNVTMRKRGNSIKFASNDCNLIESSGSDSNRPKSISCNNNSNQPSNDLDDDLDSLQSFALKLSLNTPDSEIAPNLGVDQANTKVSSAENKSGELDIPKIDDKTETAKKSGINSLKSSSNNKVLQTPSKKELQDIKRTLDEVYGPSWRLNEAEILGDLDEPNESIAINNPLNETDIGKSSHNYNKENVDCNPISQPVKSKLNFNTPGKSSTKLKNPTNNNSDLKKVSGKNKFSFSDEAASRYFENNTPTKDKTGSTKVQPEYNKKPISRQDNNTPFKIRTKTPAKTNNELFLNPNDLRKFQAITPNNNYSGIKGISGKFERKAATDIKAKIKPAFSGGLGSEIPTLPKKLVEPVKGRSITNDFMKCFFSNVPLKTIVKPTKSFLESLSKHVPSAECDQTARIFRTNYSANRAELTNRLFKLFNERVFAGCMSSNTPVEWSERLTKTGGFCRCKRVKRSTGKLERTVAITLSAKVLDTPDRLRDTLIHEMCHGANFIIDGEGGHGPSWKAWANKAMTIFPELPEIKICHSYSIDTKYTYRCLDCGYSFGRHSKSLEMDRKRCGHCFGKFELLVNKKTKDGFAKSVPAAPKREPTGFALYVKDNYSKVKTPQLKHGDVMKQLGQNFSAMKVGKKLML